MKLIKAVKKLKFWSSKKRIKDHHYNYHKLPPQYDFYPYIYHHSPPPRRPALPPSPPVGCECHFCQPAKPSAPPLPPWLEPQLLECSSGDYDEIDSFSNSINEQIEGEHSPFLEPQVLEDMSFDSDKIDTTLNSINEQETGDHCISISKEIVVIVASTTASTNTGSGQLQGNTRITDSRGSALKQHSPRREKDATAGLFGCVLDVGALLFRCFFPCLHISERHPHHLSSGPVSHIATHQNTGKKRC